MVKKCTAIVLYEDGTGSISEYTLSSGLSFALSEMRKWIKEQSDKPIKSIKFVKALTREGERAVKDE